MSASPASSKQPKPTAGTLVPTIACGASPSAHVTKDAFERIVTAMIDGIAARRPARCGLSRPARRDGDRAFRRRRRRDSGARAQGDRHGPAAGRQPRSACQRDARDGRACRRADRLPHLSACRHGRHRPRLRKTSRADAEDEGALRKGVPAIAVPDPDQLAMHQRPADQGHLSRSSRRWRATPCRRCPSRRAFRRPISRDCGPSVFAYGTDAGRRRRRGRQTAWR